MNTQSIIKTLRNHNRWIKGKGAKYINGQVDKFVIGTAIMSAIDKLKKYEKVLRAVGIADENESENN